MAAPAEILALALQQAVKSLDQSLIEDKQIASQVSYICSSPNNRAGVRMLMACLLAKLDRPQIDIRKPYTEIGTVDSYSGRSYDEEFIGPFATQHNYPATEPRVS
jgi:hypothetical protein